ncbi:phage portal protein [Streptomycetaceae bacterium NBC_01309]
MARTDLEWLTHLIDCHEREVRELKPLDAYYEGKQPLSYMAPELMQELDDRVRQVVVNWPQLVADSIEERLDVEGFRYTAEAANDRELWRIWQANNLDEQSQQGHLDALVMRRSYVIVGANDGDSQTPLITVESALDVYAEFDPRTRLVRAAVKRWCDNDGGGDVDHATLYLPNSTIWFVKQDGQWIEDPEHERDDHEMGVVPVVVLANRPRLKYLNGVSEFASVIPLSDAACKIATDMMVSAEYHATPRRVAFGFGEEDFVDEQGNKVSAFSRIIGRMWATSKAKGEGADVIQFPEANLKNFHDTLNQLARLVSSLAALPPHFLGFTTDNPASADAIRSSEARLVKRAERKQRAWGGAWEQVMRLVMLIRDGEVSAEARSLETIWRNASTPTIAQKADAAQKLREADIVPLRQTREDLGYSPPQIDRMEEEDRKAAASVLERILAGDPAAALTGPKPEPPPVPDPVVMADAA